MSRGLKWRRQPLNAVKRGRASTLPYQNTATRDFRLRASPDRGGDLRDSAETGTARHRCWRISCACATAGHLLDSCRYRRTAMLFATISEVAGEHLDRQPVADRLTTACRSTRAPAASPQRHAGAVQVAGGEGALDLSRYPAGSWRWWFGRSENQRTPPGGRSSLHGPEAAARSAPGPYRTVLLVAGRSAAAGVAVAALIRSVRLAPSRP